METNYFSPRMFFSVNYSQAYALKKKSIKQLVYLNKVTFKKQAFCRHVERDPLHEQKPLFEGTQLEIEHSVQVRTYVELIA